MDGSQRVVLAPSLRKLVDAARSERSRMALEAPDREFYLGVEAAAQGVLHPETLQARSDRWLERESRLFREGYLTALADIHVAVAGKHAPAQLALPKMTARHLRWLTEQP